MPITTKERYTGGGEIDLGFFKVSIEGRPDLSFSTNLGYRSFGCGYESLTSQTNPGPPYKNGGPFLLKRYQWSQNHRYTGVDYSDPEYFLGAFKETGAVRRFGRFTDAVTVPTTLSGAKAKHDLIAFPSTPLESYGATAFRRFSPLKNTANSAQAFAELLMDGLPTIPLKLFARLKDMRSLGNEYLNAQFGWVPLVNDIRQMYNTWQTVNSRLAQIVRDNGRPVRRSGTLMSSLDVSTSEPSGISPTQILAYGESIDSDNIPSDGIGKCTLTVRTSQKVWFSGAFRYYIPDVTDDRWSRKAKLALFGALPTPSVLYQVIPWSWLIDWFANVGDVIANFSSNGIADLVADYAYLMRHTRVEREYSIRNSPTQIIPTGKSKYAQHIPTLDFSLVELSETKERVAASPFGFGLTLGDLSDYQWSILTALGLSRQHFV